MACGVAVALAIFPGGQKKVFFKEWSMCVKHRKYGQKWLSGGAGLELGGGKAKTAPPAGIKTFCFFCLFKLQDF